MVYFTILLINVSTKGTKILHVVYSPYMWTLKSALNKNSIIHWIQPLLNYSFLRKENNTCDGYTKNILKKLYICYIYAKKQ